MATPRKLANGRYQARYSFTEAGVHRQASCGTFRLKSEAQEAINTELAKLRAGDWLDPKNRKVTVGAWTEQWLALRRAPNRKVSSFLNARIQPRWEHVALRDVSTMSVQQWINTLVADGLAPATVRGIHDTFRGILGRAVEYDLIGKNPVRGIDLPRMGEQDIVQLDADQLRLIEASTPDRFAAMIHLAAWGGLRWGECAALHWVDVDLEAGVITVRRGMKDNGTIGTTKNGKSRQVVLGPASVEVLRRHRRDFGGHELLFTTTRGSRPLSGNNFRSRVWSVIVAKAGLDPKPTYHDLRHAHAAMMVKQGMDWKVLADRLGHEKPSFTMDRYGYARQDKVAVTLVALEAAMRA